MADLEVLQFVAKSGGEATAEDVAGARKISEQAATHLLEQLEEAGYVTVHQVVGVPDRYVVNKTGRALLAEKGML